MLPNFLYILLVGCFLGCLGGAVFAPMISVVPGVGVEIIVLAFAVVVTGGLEVLLSSSRALLIGFFRTVFYFHN